MCFREKIIKRTGGRTIFYITYILIPSVDLAHYKISHAKDLGIWDLWNK